MDSGATVSLFHTSIAEDAGIDLGDSERVYLAGIGGYVKAYIKKRVKVSVEGLGTIIIPIAFTEYVGSFTRDVTAGRGSVALAIVVVSNWNPIAALLAGYLFGVAEVSALTLQAIYGMTLGISELLNTIPYIVAIIAVALYGVKARAPSRLGKPYIKE